MAVVSKLCSKMELNDNSLRFYVKSLSNLLKHDDNHVSDGALRCFASLADRYTKRGIDPAPLAEHGLVLQLLLKFSSINENSHMNNTLLSSGQSLNTSSVNSEQKSSQSLSTVISLLSTLCRSSPIITSSLLRSDLPTAIESALQGDERCILDTMRLVDLLLVLIFEGRDALPKSSVSSAPTRIQSFRRMDSVGERAHRQLIDCIRSKDTDALIDSIESGNIEVNFMDDVGQTLLNWASAFGTQQMVEFLCQKGADVNKGQRSSSLHYAACFGRPGVVKILLRHGANPDLTDEDGKTPLDKARERDDEGHREVTAVLQSPGDWMCSLRESSKTDSNKSNESDSTPQAKGDPEMAPIYLQRLLPVFCQTFQHTMARAVRKSSLNLVKKMVHYFQGQQIISINKSSPTLAPLIVEVISNVLDNEEDDESYLIVLQMIQDLMSKGSSIFLEHFARLGVIDKVQNLAGLSVNSDKLIESNDPNIQKIKDIEDEDEEDEEITEDAKEIFPGRSYHWKDWSLVRGRDCLYLWTDSTALELSNGSNGWFRFILDGKLATMYSSGSPEGGTDSSENRGEFLEKLQKARSQVKANTSQSILTSPSCPPFIIGNWSLSCRKEGELVIHNSDGDQQCTILKEDLNGFIFESNKGTTHSFTAETNLGPEFATGWSGRKGKKQRSKIEAMKQKIRTQAKEVYDVYFKTAQQAPRSTVTKLAKIVAHIERACEKQTFNNRDSCEWKEFLVIALTELSELLKEERAVSAYELHTSGLIQALLKLLANNRRKVSWRSTVSDKLLKERIELFKKEMGKDELAEALVKKLVSVLESIEKLPIYMYDSPGTCYGLQILTKRLRFRLERAPGENSLIDRTGRCLKTEPLTTVRQLEKYLLKMVAKQWYDFDRSTFNFVKKLKESKASIKFTYQRDFDENGLMYWIGTNGKTVSEWSNPAAVDLVVVTSSEGRSLPYGRLEDILSRDSTALNCHTNDDKRAAAFEEVK